MTIPPGSDTRVRLMNPGHLPQRARRSHIASDHPVAGNMKPEIRRLLYLLFFVEMVGLLIVQWPLLFNFREYAFQDTGSVLAVQSLLSRGLRPEIDFGYNYGLLPLLAGKLAFGMLGNTPRTYAFAVTAIDLIVAVGLARVVTAVRPGVLTWVLVLATMPIIIVRFDSLAYAMEAAFLVHGFAEQLRGKSTYALALALCAALSKPAMGYIYAAILLVFVIRDIGSRREERIGTQGSMASIFVGGVILIAVLVGTFGFGPFFRTVLPLQGIHHYRMIGKLQLDYKHLQGARPPGVNLNFYLGSYLAFGFVGDIWLAINAAIALFGFLKGRANPIDLFILTIGLLTLANVTVLTNYAYILPIGLIACGALAEWQKPALAVLTLLAVIAFLRSLYQDLNFSRTQVRSPATGNLWTRTDLNDEWEHAMEIASGKRTAALGEMGGVGLVVPGIERPVGAYFLPGNALPADLARESDQLASADVIILFRRFSTVSGGTVLDSFPQLDPAVQGAERVFQGKFLEVRARPRR